MNQYSNSNVPLVSIVMPAYNASRFIEEAIHSVQEQTVSDWELIIVDDCSKDETYQIVEKIALQDERIRVIRNEENLGVARTRNHAFDLCRGRYVALLDSDDIWYPQKLELQIELAEVEQADIVYCSYAMVDEHRNRKAADFIVPETTCFEDTLIKSVISCSTALLKKELIDVYRFTRDFYHEDYVFWLQMLKDNKKAVGRKEVLAEYRILSNSRAHNKINAAIHRWKIYRYFLKYSLFKSTYITLKYAIYGILKYGSSATNESEKN